MPVKRQNTGVLGLAACGGEQERRCELQPVLRDSVPGARRNVEGHVEPSRGQFGRGLPAEIGRKHRVGGAMDQRHRRLRIAALGISGRRHELSAIDARRESRKAVGDGR